MYQPKEKIPQNLQGPPNPRYYTQNKCKPGKKRTKPTIQEGEGENESIGMNNIASPSKSFERCSMLPPPIPFPDSLPLINTPSLSALEIVTSTGSNCPKNIAPNKKYFRCKECNLWLTCQQTLDVHLAGSKHARKLQELELANFAKEISSYVLNEGENVFKCKLCNVFASSVVQLKSHVEGAKHKNKVKSISESQAAVQSLAMDVKSIEKIDRSESTTNQTDINAKFYCNVCNKPLNSQTQHDQHVASKKHIAKVAVMQVTNVGQKRKFPFNGEDSLKSTAVPQKKAFELPKYDAFDPSFD